jgi:hypothetical protein
LIAGIGESNPKVKVEQEEVKAPSATTSINSTEKKMQPLHEDRKGSKLPN